jgi:hypothetical protein
LESLILLTHGAAYGIFFEYSIAGNDGARCPADAFKRELSTEKIEGTGKHR